MKYVSIAGLLIIMVIGGCRQSQKDITTFILVRHAEKASDGSDDPDLTDAGRTRAEKLASMFKDTPFTSIYSTGFKRTVQTAYPLAAAHGLKVQKYEALKRDVIEGIIDEHRGGIVLMTGHSDTTPWTANLLTGEETYSKYAESEYGTILIVAVTEVGKSASVIRINY